MTSNYMTEVSIPSKAVDILCVYLKVFFFFLDLLCYGRATIV